MLRLHTLGRLELEGAPHQAAQVVLQGPKRAGLLVYLARAQPTGLKRRDTLLALFWPELDQARARHALRNTLHSLRTSLGTDLFTSAGSEAVGIAAGRLSCDADEFDAALADNRLDEAVAQYGGDFLAGFFLPESAEFEQWITSERQQLRRAYHAAVERLAENAANREDWIGAVEWWRQLVEAEPYSARLTLRLMEALEAAGDRAGALQRARQHAQLLQKEFGAEADTDVLALAERLRSEPAAVSGRSSARSVVPKDISDRDELRTWEVPAEQRASPSVPPRLTRGATIVLICLIGLVGVMAAFWRRRSPSPVLDSQRVVIAPFENRTGDSTLDPAGTMAADWIIQGLLRTALVDVTTATATLVSSERVQAAMRAESSLDPVRALAEETGAGLVVSGAYYRQGDSLLFQARITDARRRVVVRTLEPISAPAARPLVGIERLRQRLLAALAPLLDPRLVAEGRVSSQPPSYEAYRAYAEGMEQMIAGRWRTSITHFEEAVSLDSSYLLPSLLIAVAQANLSEYAQADSIARLLDRSRDRLGAYDRALLDMLMTWISGDPVARYATARRAAAIAPGSLPNVQWGLEALFLNRPRETISILSAIDPTRGEVRGWRAYWKALTMAYHLIGDHQTELATARRAAQVVTDRLFWFGEEARALAAMGRMDELHAVVNRALASASRDSGAVRVLTFLIHTADELRAHGHPAAARQLADRAISWSESRSAEEQQRARHVMLAIYYSAGRNSEAQALVDQLVEEDPEDLEYRAIAGGLAARRGASAEARRIEAWLDAQERPYAHGSKFYMEACIEAELRQPARAVELLRTAASKGGTSYLLAHVDPCFDPIRGDSAFSALLRPAE